MLPGVELARRRRFHNRNDVLLRGFQDTPSTAPPQRIDEPAAEAARRRLEEKLRRPLFGSTSPSSSTSPASHFSRWLRTSTASALENSRQVRASQDSGMAMSSNSSGCTGKNGAERKKRVSKTDLCAVCLEGFRVHQQVIWLPCAHRYHSACVLPWLADHSHCPCCRTEVPSLELLTETALTENCGGAEL